MKKFILTGLFITLLISLLVTQDNENVSPVVKPVDPKEAIEQKQTDKKYVKKEHKLKDRSVSKVFIEQ